MQHIHLPESILTAPLQKVADALSLPRRELRLVGGCVRDILLGKEPNDIDLAIGLMPHKVIERLKAKNIRVIETGIAHGTVTAIVGTEQFEITSLRKDVSCDGRHAEVEFTTDWKEDAARRDFTINAMSCNLGGELFDYFNGQQDLADKKVIFVGDPKRRIQEDALRILRFFRFASYYNDQELDQASLEACIKQKDLLKGLSGERIQTEMMKLLEAENPIHIVDIMYKENVLPYVSLTLESCDIFKNLIALEKKNIAPIDPYIRLATLLKNAALSDRKAILSLSNSWRLSNKDGLHLSNLTLPRQQITPQMTESEQKSLLRQIGKSYYTQLIYISMAAEPDSQDALLKMLSLASEWEIPIFPLSGRDILAIGIPPGKTVGTFLKSAEIWWEERQYQPSREDIINWIKDQH